MFDLDDREDRKTLPITAKQLAFAQKLALQNGAILPWDAQQSRAALSAWIGLPPEKWSSLMYGL